jgi:hypothetical protein
VLTSGLFACSCLDVDCDGFLGGGDLQHWYRISEQFLDTQVRKTLSASHKSCMCQQAHQLF